MVKVGREAISAEGEGASGRRTDFCNGSLDLTGPPAESGEAGYTWLDKGCVIRVPEQINHQIRGGSLHGVQELSVGGVEVGVITEEYGQV